MKNKLDFYIAFYEQLALNGFQAYVPFTNKNHIADICENGYNIAHLTKDDAIEPNPYAVGVETGTIDTIREIAKNTAIRFGFYTEKPYDEAKNDQLPDGSYKLAECDGTLLSCKQHPFFGYVFTVSRQSTTPGEPVEQQNYYNKADAKHGFAVSSGIVNENQLFSEKGLTAIYENLMKQLMTPDNGLDSAAAQESEYILAQIEDLMPSLGSCCTCYDLDVDASLSEGIEQ